MEKVTVEQKVILKDYSKQVVKYWKNKANVTPNLQWHLLYFLRGGVKDVRCIPEEIFFEKILPKLNDFRFCKAYADKCNYEIHFPLIKQPKTIVKNINGIYYDSFMNVVSYEKVIEIIKGTDKWSILKPSIESGNGKGILFINSVEMSESEIRNVIESQQNYIVQELFLEQSKVIKELNPTSLNTIRIMTLLWKGEVHDLSAHIRVGPSDSHFDHYGTSRPITRDGVILKKSINCDDERTPMVNDNFGKPLVEVSIPNYQNVLNIIKTLHLHCPYFSIIGWDIALDCENNPVLIEVNNDYPGVNAHQIFFGPILEDYTDEVLDYVFKN